MELIIDHREKKICEILNAREITYSVKSLDIGDIIIKDNNNEIVLIERKTLSDLYNSIKDGRYHEQKSRIKGFQGKIFYLIEGFLDKTNPYYDILISSMVSTQFRDNFLIYQTKNTEESVDFILRLFKRLPEFKTDQTAGYFSNIQIKKKDNFTPEIFYLSILCEIPGISKNIASVIQKEYPKLSILIKALEGGINIENLQIEYESGRKRKIGKKIADKIKDYLLDHQEQTKMEVD